MNDKFKETNTTSYGNRVSSSFTVAIIGVLFFIATFPLIFWNEGRSIDRIKTLDEGRGLVVAVDSKQIDSMNNGKLIHISGIAVTNDVLNDASFGVQETALKLNRTVEMYQWEESKESERRANSGASTTTTTTYYYKKTWSKNYIDSSNFNQRNGHENPQMPYASKLYSANNIKIGAFALTNHFIRQIYQFEPYPLAQRNFDTMDSNLKKDFILNGDTYFHGDPTNPDIGAIRISYEIIKPTAISVIGKQDNESIGVYYTKKGSINLLEMRDVSADSMFANAESANSLETWAMRIGAFFLMWSGLAMFFRPIKILGDVVPLVGTILGAGIGLLAFTISLVLVFSTIAFAWLAFRPVIGLVLLILAGGFFLGGFKTIKRIIQRDKPIGDYTLNGN